MRETVLSLTLFLFSVIAFTLSEVAAAEWRKNTVVNRTTENLYSISIALTEEGQSAFKAAFEQHLMDTEKLELSDLTTFTIDTYQHAEELDSVKSLTDQEHFESVCTIFDNLVNLGVSYYDYHETHKVQPAEEAPDLSIEV